MSTVNSEYYPLFFLIGCQGYVNNMLSSKGEGISVYTAIAIVKSSRVASG